MTRWHIVSCIFTVTSIAFFFLFALQTQSFFLFVSPCFCNGKCRSMMAMTTTIVDEIFKIKFYSARSKLPVCFICFVSTIQTAISNIGKRKINFNILFKWKFRDSRLAERRFVSVFCRSPSSSSSSSSFS